MTTGSLEALGPFVTAAFVRRGSRASERPCVARATRTMHATIRRLPATGASARGSP
jgi:hypothetical protein